MTELKVGYARLSTVDHGLTVQGEALSAPGACRSGDTLVVTKLDGLARCVPDARDIVDELSAGGGRFNNRGSVHDSTNPIAGGGKELIESKVVCTERGQPWHPREPRSPLAERSTE